MDRVGFVFNREGEGDEPIALIIIEEGQLRFYGDPTTEMGRICSDLNSRTGNLDPEVAEDYFETYADRWTGQNRNTTVREFVGRDARRAEMLIAKWNKAQGKKK